MAFPAPEGLIIPPFRFSITGIFGGNQILFFIFVPAALLPSPLSFRTLSTIVFSYTNFHKLTFFVIYLNNFNTNFNHIAK